MSTKPICICCGDDYATARREAGYNLCLRCGEEQARRVRFTVAPMHKSNYLLISNPDDLKGLNNKGGMYR